MPPCCLLAPIHPPRCLLTVSWSESRLSYQRTSSNVLTKSCITWWHHQITWKGNYNQTLTQQTASYLEISLWTWIEPNCHFFRNVSHQKTKMRFNKPRDDFLCWFQLQQVLAVTNQKPSDLMHKTLHETKHSKASQSHHLNLLPFGR